MIQRIYFARIIQKRRLKTYNNLGCMHRHYIVQSQQFVPINQISTCLFLIQQYPLIIQMDLHSGYWPESLCLFTQLSITLITTIRIHDNQDEFPIKQLGPSSTIICSLCFLLANLINLIGRFINEAHSSPFPCKIYSSNSLFVLAIFYNTVRQLPFVLFTIKTLRVSLCFWPPFNKINIQDVNKCFVGFMKNQTYFVVGSIAYVAFINLLNVAILDVHPKYSSLTYQYFCPKLPSTFDLIVTIVRLLTLAFVLYLSLWAYEELDFKKFLFLIFLISNLYIVPHVLLTIGKHYFQYDITNRDSIYYTSFIVELLSSCLILYYSGINKQLTQPAMQGVLQSWQAFHNLKLGMDVLFNYAEYKDAHSEGHKYNFRCLESFDYLDQLLKQLKRNPYFELKYELTGVEKILERNELVKAKLGQATTMQYRKRCADGSLKVESVQKIEKILSFYCENEIFNDWKKTKSYKSLKQEFINNGDINEKLALFGVPVS